MRFWCNELISNCWHFLAALQVSALRGRSSQESGDSHRATFKNLHAQRDGNVRFRRNAPAARMVTITFRS